MNVKEAIALFKNHQKSSLKQRTQPLEIISKVILRHQDLKITQVYLGKVSDSEAIRWMDVLHER